MLFVVAGQDEPLALSTLMDVDGLGLALVFVCDAEISVGEAPAAATVGLAAGHLA